MAESGYFVPNIMGRRGIINPEIRVPDSQPKAENLGILPGTHHVLLKEPLLNYRMCGALNYNNNNLGGLKKPKTQ